VDERLVRQVQEGDAEAFRSLVVASHARMLRVAQGVVRDPHVAEDAVKQAFLGVFGYITPYGPPPVPEGFPGEATEE
jgi:DNA-directed RNA polymerase specialized sigma24 family protein